MIIGPHGVEGDEGERRPGPLDLGEEDELVRGGPALPAELLGPADAQPAVLAHTAHERAEYLAALGLAVEGVADLVSQEVGEVGPELRPQGQLLRQSLRGA